MHNILQSDNSKQKGQKRNLLENPNKNEKNVIKWKMKNEMNKNSQKQNKKRLRLIFYEK